jgi:ABC-type sugar transport system ATPase subunit
LYEGQVHALLGQNGAGKSTLISIMSGALQANSGVMELAGQEVSFASPSEALASGVVAVYQELSLLPDMTVAENLFLGIEPGHGPLISRTQMRTKAREILDTLGATDIDPGTVVGDLNIANQQLVEISKALTRQARVVILDEPSAVLGSQELDLLYAMVRRLTAGGIAVVYITHRLDEVQEIADVVTVMRDGRKVLDEARSEVSKTEMISAMVGREVLLDAPPKWQVGVSRAQDGPTLSVQNVVLPGMAGEALNFEVQSGEIVGIAGLTGSGRSRILRLLAGLEPPLSGKVNLGQTVLNLRTPRSAIAQGIVLVPEDRKRLGLILNQSVISNTVLSILSRISRLGFISRSSSRGRTQEMVDRLSIKIASMNQEVRYLSGGNQQKVVIARCIGTNPKLLLLDEPLRGVDIGAKSEIVDIVGQIAEQGTAVIVVSSEIEDVLALTDRILVVRDGCIVRELIGDEATETMVLQYSSVRQS